MAMVKCKECGHQISDKAKTCPSCGATVPKKTSAFTWFIAIVFGIPVIFAMATSGGDRPSPGSPPSPTDLRLTAAGGCREFIKQRLHDPSGAEFGLSQDAAVEMKGERAAVTRSVRANNGFGAKRLTHYTCLLEISGGKVRLVSLMEAGLNSQKAAADWVK